MKWQRSVWYATWWYSVSSSYCAIRNCWFLVAWSGPAHSKLFPIYPAPRDVTAGSLYTARALGHMPCSGWCRAFPSSLPSSCTPPVAWTLWPLGWVQQGLATPVQRISHSESTFWRRRRYQDFCSGTRSSVVNILKTVPPPSLPHSRTWPGARLVLRSFQKKLSSEWCSCCRIHFLFCLRPTAPSLRSLRQTSLFSQAFDSYCRCNFLEYVETTGFDGAGHAIETMYLAIEAPELLIEYIPWWNR